MLSHIPTAKYGTYGFRFKGSHQQRIAGLFSIGWEKQTKPTYDWNGLARIEKDVIVFQYTLKGAGEIKIAEETHRLEVGSAFFVDIPGDHRYYFPSDSSEWEFVHVTFFGDEARNIFNKVINRSGHILNLDIHSPPITHILKLIEEVFDDRVSDAYTGSSFVYSFLMELERYTLNIQSNQEYPSAISNAVEYIKDNYIEQLSLDDIVAVSGLSKYHFTRLFQKYLHVTPIQFLTTTRINHSVNLLKNTSLTIHEIAIRVGFSNGNYFGKVFRANRGVSPGSYRNSKTFIPMDHLISDY